MQTNVQDMSAMLGGQFQVPASAPVSSVNLQPIGSNGEILGNDFLASLDASLQALAEGEQSPLVPFDPAQLLGAFQQYLGGGQSLPGGNGLPLAEGEVADELTPELREMMSRLQSLLEETPATNLTALADVAPEPSPEPSPESSTSAIDDVVMYSVTANVEAQALLEQRRIFERIQLMPEMRQSGAELPAAALQQVLGRQLTQAQAHPQQPVITAEPDDVVTAVTSQPTVPMSPVQQGDDFALHLLRMTEMKGVAMSVTEGAAIDTLVRDSVTDVAAFSSAALQRHTGATTVSDARPTNPAFIPLPLNDPKWQGEFNDRVTWLARAGGNQTAEIRLNPANMGPIEVRVVMKDDQATITFAAHHGVVRDAIEASLPRLREMFAGNGMQLANASVSDQPLQEQRRQQQQSGSGSDGGSRGHYGRSDEIENMVSPVMLTSSSSSSMLADRVDYYA